jgi:hypothetical protein
MARENLVRVRTMTARILPYQIALLTLVRELEYTLSQMNHEPLAAPPGAGVALRAQGR